MNIPLLAPLGVSISDLKKNPSAVIADAGDLPVAVLNRNTPAAYILSAKAWEAILERLDDAELAAIVRRREGQEAVKVRIEDL